MRNLKELVALYREVIGWRVLCLLTVLMIFPPILEGLSATFILPLLQGLEADSPAVNTFREIFKYSGISFTLFNLLVLMVLTVTVSSVILILHAAVTGKALNQLTIKLRKRLIEETFQLDYQKASSYSHGHLNHAIVNEANAVVFSFQLLATLTISSIYALVYTLIPLMINPTLVFFMIVVGAVFLPLFKIFNKKAKRYSKLSSLKSSSLQSFIIQAITNFKYLKATNRHGDIANHINVESEDLGNVKYKQSFLSSLSKFGFEPMIVMIVASLIFYFVEVKGESIIECGFLLFLMNRSMRSVLGMQQNLQKLFSSWGSVHVIRKYMSELKENQEADVIDHTTIQNGDIRLKDVSFFYGDTKIIDSVSLHIKKNSTIAFVGESGSGKSTLVNIIIGLLKKGTGQIFIGEHGYDEISLKSFRKKVGYITQENVIFNDSFRNNITMWDSTGDESEQVEKLSKVVNKAHLKEFIDTSELGLDTILGENGVKLSGGQKQRVCIARELYKQPSILVCDEATSALDTATEKEIQRNIDEMKGECTIILIAHRLSTVKNADEIFVLKNGSIIESGNYDSLIALDGQFKEMVSLQS